MHHFWKTDYPKIGSLQLCILTDIHTYRKGDKVLYNQAKLYIEKEIRAAKRNYSDKLWVNNSRQRSQLILST